MPTSKRINIVLFVTVCALAVLVWLTRAQQSSERETQKLSALDVTQIARIEIEKPGRPKNQKTVLEFSGGQWTMTQPLHIEANQFLARKVAGMAGSAVTRKFDVTDKQLPEFGLTPAAITLHLDSLTLRLGNTHPINGQRYVQLLNSATANSATTKSSSTSTLLLIQDDVTRILNSAPDGFVSHKLLPGAARITALQLPDFSLQLEQGTWVFKPAPATQPLPAGISQDRFVAFVDNWRLARALYVRLAQATGAQAALLTPPQDTSSKDARPKDASSKRVLIQLADGRNINLSINSNPDGLQFVRRDLGIHYHMHNDTQQSLLTFSVAKP